MCGIKVTAVIAVNHTEVALAFSAGRTLATAFMFVELNQASNGSDDVSLKKACSNFSWSNCDRCFIVYLYEINWATDVTNVQICP